MQRHCAPRGRLSGAVVALAAYPCVNDQWRVIFKWTPDGPDAVDVVDYH